MTELVNFLRLYYKYILVLLWMAVIFILSNEPAVVSSGRSAAIVSTLSGSFHVGISQVVLTFLVRKSAHITAYFILGILIFNVLRNYKIRCVLMIAIALGLAFCYAVSDELHQLFVVGRSCELRDVMIDTTASLTGILMAILIRQILAKHIAKPGL